MQEITDEVLMAYADGALDAAESAAVAEAVAADAALAARLAIFIGTGQVLAQAARARAAEPAPEAVVAAARQALSAGKVVPLAPRRAAWQPAALAASLALAVGLGGGYLLAGKPATGPLAALGTPSVAAALDRLASGERGAVDGGEIALIATFRDGDGALCREFELDRGDAATVSVACRDGDAWQPRLAIAAPAVDREGYAPASSLEALDAFLASIGAAAPMGAAEEAAALAE